MLKQSASLGVLMLAALTGSGLGFSQLPAPSVLRGEGTSFSTSASASARRPVEAPVYVATDKTHTVKSGETLWGIARQYRLDFDELAQLNDRQSDPVIRIGEVLKLPLKGRATAAPAGGSPAVRAASEHEVASGETLFGIARRYGVTVDALKSLNGIDDPASLRAGQTLKVPASTATGQSARPKPVSSPAPTPPPGPSAPRPGPEPIRHAVEPVPVPGSVPSNTKLAQPEPVAEASEPAPAPTPPRADATILAVPSAGGAQESGVIRAFRDLAAQPFQSPSRLPAPFGAPSEADRRPSMVTERLVEPNDTLEEVAKMYGTTVDQIRLDNPGIHSNRDLRVGGRLKVRAGLPASSGALHARP